MRIHKVLMVDDEPDIRRIAMISLRGVGGWQVILASSGPQGIGLAYRECPDVILLDVMMPGMDGPATLSGLRALSATAVIPVIFMTAKVQKREIENYLRLGAAGVLSKPFDPMRLPADVERVFDDHWSTRAIRGVAS